MTTQEQKVRQAEPWMKNESADMVQTDILGTPLPNGLLRWFGFEFDRVNLPSEPLMAGGHYIKWTGAPDIFLYQFRLVDARITIAVEEFQDHESDELEVYPANYRLTVEAHGFNQDEAEVFGRWSDVQQRCLELERELDRDFHDRHADCLDEDGNWTECTCSFCEGFGP